MSAEDTSDYDFPLYDGLLIDGSATYNRTTGVVDDNDPLVFELYESQDASRTGGTRTHYQADQQWQTIHEDRRSSCAVAIERLVWVDGWSGKPDADGRDKAMTLVVLKLSVNPYGSNKQVTFASLHLKLEASTEGGLDPCVVAWGPFRRLEKWDLTDVSKETGHDYNAKVSGGVAGQGVSLGLAGMTKERWKESVGVCGTSAKLGHGNHRYARSASDPTADTERTANGVQWKVARKKFQERGIGNNEIRFAALFERRDAADTYKASVKVVTQINGIFQSALRQVHLGDSRPDTITWDVNVRPGDTSRCAAEGTDIVKHVDLNDLGSLSSEDDVTDLRDDWLNRCIRLWRPDVSRQPNNPPAPEVLTTKTGFERELIQSIPTKKMEALDKEPIAVHLERSRTREEENISLDGVEVDVGNGRVGTGWNNGEEEDSSPKDEDDMESSGGGEDLDANEESGSVDENDGVGRRNTANCSRPSRRKRSAAWGGAAVRTVDSDNYDGHWRLVELEKRAALAEARIAQQDRQILELQQAFSHMSQAFLNQVPAMPTGRRRRAERTHQTNK